MNKSSSQREKIHREVMDIAREISDPYVRSITLARIGYRLAKNGDPQYKKAFSWAMSALKSIENPILMLKAMVEISRYFSLSGLEERARDILTNAYEGALLLKSSARDTILVEIARGALAIGRPEDTIFYSTDIQDPEKRDRLIFEVIRHYLKEGNIRKAESLLDTLSSEEIKSRASFEILQKHLERGEFASAMRLIPKMEKGYWMDMAMEEIAKKLAEAEVSNKVYEKFMEAAKEISLSTGRDHITTFLLGLSKGGNLRFVAETVNSLDGTLRLKAAENIITALLTQPEKLYIFLETLTLPPEEFDALAKRIMDELLRETPSEKYRDLAVLIGQRTEDESVLVKVATYLSKIGLIEEAKTFAGQIEDPYLRSLAFGAIALGYLKRGDVGSAIDAVMEVRDREWSSWLMGEILVKVLDSSIGERAEEELGERARKHMEFKKKVES